MAKSLGVHERKVLDLLASGSEFRRSAGGWKAGSIFAPPNLVENLRRRSLIRERDDGRLELIPGTTSYQPRRSKRILVEQPLPRDGADRQAPAIKPARSVMVNAMESPLGWLKARGMISERQFNAGERLRGDWTISGLSPRVTMRWDPSPVAQGRGRPAEHLDPTIARLAAKQRFDEAIASAGPGLSDILWRVVCAGEGLADAETTLGWPKRAGKLVLSLALDRVADFYREP